MANFKFNAAAQVTAKFSGGLSGLDYLFDETVGVTTPIAAGFTGLEFIGNATGAASGITGVVGGTGDDILIGLDGNDVFTGGTGLNQIDGGVGDDTAGFDFSDQLGDVKFVNHGVVGETYAITSGGAAYGSVKNIEATGDLKGGAGNDRIGGVYQIPGRSYTLTGGGGIDTIVIDASTNTAAKFSGGLVPGYLLYDEATDKGFTLNADIEALEFTGNATGAANGLTGVFGGTGNDTLTGLDGDDVFHGGTGLNKIDGGVGKDTAGFDFSDQLGDVVFVNRDVGNTTYGITSGGKAYGSVTSIEATGDLKGGAGNDRIGGAYKIAGKSYTLTGGGGIDTIVIDASTNTAAKFSGGLVPNYLLFDEVTTTGFTLNADIEALDFTGNATGAANGLFGVFGGTGNDTLTGLDGDDVFHGGTGLNKINGGAGMDTAEFDFSDQLGDVVFVNRDVGNTTYGITSGGKAYGSVTSIEATGDLKGGAGNDRIGGVYKIAGKSYTLTGGGGIDTIVIDASTNTAAKFSGGLVPDYFLFDEVENARFTLNADIEALEFKGNATGAANGLFGVFGGTGNDTLTGLDGDDVFHGGTGLNKIDGGAGKDTAGFDFSDQLGDVVFVNRGVGDKTYGVTSGGAAYGWARNIEATGDLKGGAGNDRIGGVYGIAEKSYTLTGGGGIDTIVIDASTNTAAKFSGGLVPNHLLFDEVATTGFTLNADIEALEFKGNATGAANGLFGVFCGTGNDTLTGLDGDDVFHGGTGLNKIDGGAGKDTAGFDFSDQLGDVVFVNRGVGDKTYGVTSGGAAYGWARNIEATGDLKGGAGNDRIGGVYGIAGRFYTLTGGGGIDTIVIDASTNTAAKFSGGLVPNHFLFDEVTTTGFILNADIEALEFTGNATGASRIPSFSTMISL